MVNEKKKFAIPVLDAQDSMDPNVLRYGYCQKYVPVETIPRVGKGIR